MAKANFERVWNDWHLSICSTVELTSHVLEELTNHDVPDWMKSAAAICAERLQEQSINAPVPPWDRYRD